MPLVITPRQTFDILNSLPLLQQTMVVLDPATGLRYSEIAGLEWQDVDWDKNQIHVRRRWIWGTVRQPEVSFRRALDGRPHVRRKLVVVCFVQIHHVSGGVVVEMDPPAQILGQQEMVHGVFRREERCGHVEVPVLDFDLQLRAREQRCDQVVFHARRSGKSAATVRLAVLPVPVAYGLEVEDFIGAIAQEFQILAQATVDGRRESGGHRGIRGIGFGMFGEQIVSGAGEARVVPSGSESFAALDFREIAKVRRTSRP